MPEPFPCIRCKRRLTVDLDTQRCRRCNDYLANHRSLWKRVFWKRLPCGCDVSHLSDKRRWCSYHLLHYVRGDR